MLFTFRKYSEIQKESVQFTNGSYITFDFLEDICDMELLKRARTYARENRNIILVNTDERRSMSWWQRRFTTNPAGS